jgi:ketosteroid isomerase-like protein
VASANLDLVRSIYAARARGDYSSAEWAHPDIEYVVVDGPAPGTWSGRAALADVMRDYMSAWQGFRGEAAEYRELDDNRVLVLVQMSGRGKTSGVDLEQLGAKVAVLYNIRDGKVTRVVHYWDHERALADLGLTSETGS